MRGGDLESPRFYNSIDEKELTYERLPMLETEPDLGRYVRVGVVVVVLCHVVGNLPNEAVEDGG